MFDDLMRNLIDGGSGVRAYEHCAREARRRVADEPQNAAALLLIAYAAQRFVDAYDDQPLTVEAAAEELKQFSHIATTLNAAYLSGSAESKIKALNEVAVQLSPRN